MKFGLILLLLLAGVVLGIRMLFSRESGKPRYTDMPQLLALCDSKNAPAVKEALLHSDEGALRNEETTLLHVLLERDADPAVLREALSPPSPLLRMVQLTDAQGRTPLHIAAARANPAALLLLHCMGARDTTPDREGRLALDIIQELGADEMAARLPFWENRGKQEGRMVVNLQQSKTVQIRGRKYRLEAKGFLSYASLATNEGELAYVAAVQGAAASLPEDERYNIQNNDTDLPYIRTISAFPRCRGFRARFPLVLAERRVPGRGVGTPGRAAQMPVAEGFPAHAEGPDRSGLPGRSRQACGGTPRRMVGMGYPGRRSGPGTAGRQRKPAETAAGHHHLVQPLGAFLLPVVSPQQHAHVFRLAAARRPAGRRRLASGSQGSRARSGDLYDIRAALGRERWRKAGGICAPRHGWRNKRPRTNCSKRPWTTGTAPRT